MTVSALGGEAIGRIKSRGRRKSVLLMGIRQEVLMRLAPQLGQKTIDLVVAHDVDAALKISSDRRFDLMVIRHPVVGLPIDELLTELRRPQGPSSRAYVLVLTEAASDEALKELASERSRFANASDFDVILSVLARNVLGVAQRVGSRLMVQIGMRMLGARLAHFCQVMNVSESGMLIRTGDRPGLGEIVEVTFSLPETPQPVHSKAEVVRHTGPPEIEGVALRFVDLDRTSRGRIRDYIGARLGS